MLVPEKVLLAIFAQAKKSKGPIPVCGTINGKSYTQTLVKYQGIWRLYINMKMLPRSPQRIGETLTVSIAWDNQERMIEMPVAFKEALEKDSEAQQQFDQLSPSLRKEIVRYLSFLKKEETLQKNIALAIGFLKGQNRFVGRNPNKSK